MFQGVMVALPMTGHTRKRVDVGADRQLLDLALPGRVGVNSLPFWLRNGLGGVAARLRRLALREQIGELVSGSF